MQTAPKRNCSCPWSWPSDEALAIDEPALTVLAGLPLLVSVLTGIAGLAGTAGTWLPVLACNQESFNSS